MEERLHQGETKEDVQETAAGDDSPRSIAPDSKYSKERQTKPTRAAKQQILCA